MCVVLNIMLNSTRRMNIILEWEEEIAREEARESEIKKERKRERLYILTRQ